jgi:hypothetical protein
MFPHFISLAVIEAVPPSYSNRVSCSLQIVGQSSISVPQQFWHDYYCRSPYVAYFTFDSYSLITVITATAANLRIVGNNRLPYCRLIIYIKVLELEIKHKHGAFNINYEKLLWWYGNSLGLDRNPNSSDNPVCMSVQSYGKYCHQQYVPSLYRITTVAQLCAT